MSLTDGRGADIIVDTVSGREVERDLGRLAFYGTVVATVGAPATVDTALVFERGLNVATLNLGGAHQRGSLAQRRDLGVVAGELVRLVSLGKLDPMMAKPLPFDKLKDGLELIKAHKNLGKLVASLR
jgi:NADPH:quinone reductase-like Zn-dependent oxidoreductase